MDRKISVNESITTRQAAEIYVVTIRRVQQLVKEYRERNIIHTDFSRIIC